LIFFKISLFAECAEENRAKKDNKISDPNGARDEAEPIISLVRAWDRALRKPRSNGHSASFARTTARKTARRNLRVVPKRALFFGSIVAPANGRQKNVALKERDHSRNVHHRIRFKKKGGGQNLSKSSPLRCDAKRRTWTLVALRPATDAIC